MGSAPYRPNPWFLMLTWGRFGAQAWAPDLPGVICKSNLHLGPDTTTPASHRSVFYRPDALPAAQPTASKHWSQVFDSLRAYKLFFSVQYISLFYNLFTRISVVVNTGKRSTKTTTTSDQLMLCTHRPVLHVELISLSRSKPSNCVYMQHVPTTLHVLFASDRSQSERVFLTCKQNDSHCFGARSYFAAEHCINSIVSYFAKTFSFSKCKFNNQLHKTVNHQQLSLVCSYRVLLFLWFSLLNVSVRE